MEKIKNKKGIVKFSREMLIENPEEKVLNAVFSVFYPVVSEIEHNIAFTDSIKMFGYSPLFRELEEAEVMPEYLISVNTQKNKASVKEL